MAKRYTRQEFLDRLRAEIGRGKPLVMTGAGNGIAAKFIERGGVDILGVYNTGYFRMQGYGSLAGMLPMADANEMVYHDGQARGAAPGEGGAGGRRAERRGRRCATCGCSWRTCRRIGFSGVHNFPTVAWFDGEFRRTLEGTGPGLRARDRHAQHRARAGPADHRLRVQRGGHASG